MVQPILSASRLKKSTTHMTDITYGKQEKPPKRLPTGTTLFTINLSYKVIDNLNRPKPP